MSDTTVKKIDSSQSPTGDLGQKYLASGTHIAMRLWERIEPHDDSEPSQREYETVGFVLEGEAKLHLEDQVVSLKRGDSWVVPRGSKHWYEILQPFTAVEATTPPAHVHGRDDAHGHISR